MDGAPPRRTMRRPSARALKRSLLAAVLLAIAFTAVQRPTSRTGRHTRAAAGTGSATVIAEPTRSPRSGPSAQPRAVAATVAQAYARYLDDQLPAPRLPALTPQALATARNSGPLPARLHVTQVRLTSLTGRGDSWTAHFAISDTHGRQTTTTQLILSATDGPRQVARADPARPRHPHHPEPARPPTNRPHRRPPRRARIHPQLPRLHLRPSRLRQAARPHPQTADLDRRQPAPGTGSRPRAAPPHRNPRAHTRWRTLAGRRERHRRTTHLPGHQPRRPRPRRLAHRRAATRTMS